MQDIEQIKQKVKKRGGLPIIALGGEERALIDDVLTFLRQETLDKENQELNHHKLLASEIEITQVVNALDTMPFLGSLRLVELHQAEKLTQAEESILLEYIKNPCTSSILVLIFNKVDKRNKFISALNNHGFFFSIESPGENALVSLIIEYGREQKIKINQKIAHFLALILDKDLLLIKAYISKLGLLFENQEITLDQIQEHINQNGEPDVFLLVRMISEGKLADSLFTLNQIRSKQENALKFLGLLAWQFRTLVHIRYCLDQNMPEHEISKTVAIFKDRFSWMANIARKKNMEFHTNRLAKLLECDAAIKTLNTEPFTLIEKFIYQSAIGL